jgi:hypothetical protein
MPILASPVLLSLGWCVLGYIFLGSGESAFAVISSMAAITTAGLSHRADVGRPTLEGSR